MSASTLFLQVFMLRECVTYSVCDHFHPNKLALGSLNVVTVKPQIYKPVVHTHTKVPVSYEGAQQSKARRRKCTGVPLMSLIGGTVHINNLEQCRI